MTTPIHRRQALRIIGAAPFAASVPARSGAQQLTTVRVGASLDDGITPLLYAMHSGIFTKYGLAVQLQGATSGAALASAVAGGVVDIAKSSLMSLITAYAHGIRFKIVAGAALYLAHEPTTLLCGLKDGPVKTLADVDGKTIACIALRSLDQLGIQALIDKHGGNSATVQFIELPFSTMLPALQDGRAVLAAITNPVLANDLATGKLKTFGDSYEGIGAPLLIAGWFCTQDYLARSRDAASRFGQAMREAATYTNAHHAETVPLLADYAHLDPEVIKKMNRLTNATSVAANEIQPSINAAAKYKYIDAAFSARELLA